MVQPDHEIGGYNVSVPALPGCFTQGDTVEEYLVRVRDAIATYLDGETKESLHAAGVEPDMIVDVVEVETESPRSTIERFTRANKSSPPQPTASADHAVRAAAWVQRGHRSLCRAVDRDQGGIAAAG